MNRVHILSNPNVLGSYNENKEKQLHAQSLERTSKWNDNYRDLKKRKEDEKYRKFEKDELARRQLDEEERAFQHHIKEHELQKANQKLFQNDERVRALNSQLLCSDALKGR